MAHKKDYWESIRKTFLKPLHKILSVYGLYAETYTGKAEYVGTVELGEEETETLLHALGFTRNWIASYHKYGWNTERYESGSFVKREPSDDTQLHAVTYSIPSETHIFAHFEYNYLTHPIKHYKGEDFSPRKGAKEMKSSMESENIEYFHRPPY